MNIIDKASTRILICSNISAGRQLTSEALRNIGYQKITLVSTGKDIINFLAVEEVEWIVTYASIDSDLNAIALLNLIIKEPSLKNIKVSIICEESESYLLPQAFELGAFSYHDQTFILDELVESFNNLMTFMKANNNNYTLTSAEYLRTFLIQKNHLKSLVTLEQNLLSMFPGNKRLLYCAAEAEFLYNNPQKGVQIVEQLKLLAPKMIEHCNRLLKKFNIEESNLEIGQAANIIGIKNAIVIDPDSDVNKNIEDLLHSIGVKKVERFDSSDVAYNWLVSHSERPALVVMEWRQIGIPGPAFIQRIRADLKVDCPIVVASSLIKKEDFNLVKEIGVSSIIQKPFESQDFFEGIILAVQQIKRPSNRDSYLLKVRSFLKDEKFELAERLIHEYTNSDIAENGTKLELLAEYCYARGNYTKAKELALKGLKQSFDTINLLNLIGKILLALKEYKAALSFFEKSQEYSPKNIERLYNISDASLQSDDVAKARVALESIKKIDASHPRIPEYEAKIGLASGNLEQSKEAFKNLDSSENIISFMNSRAIALVRNNRFDDAISLYSKTIESIPQKWESLKSVVYYNMALAYARSFNLAEAKACLTGLSTFLNDSLKKKIEALIKKIETSQNTNSPLNLSQIGFEILTPYLPSPKEMKFIQNVLETTDPRLLNYEPARGDICCYLIYYCLEGIDQRAKDMLNLNIRFAKR